MRIGIDARLFESERTGIGTYTDHLLRSFAQQEAREDYVLFTDRPVTLPGTNFTNTVIPVKKRVLWSLFFVSAALYTRKVDLYHATVNFEVPLFAPCKMVCTVHDLIPLYFPDLVSRKFYLLFRNLIGRAMRKSARVITVSEYSRHDILSRFSLPPEKVTVIPHAPHPRFQNVPDPDERKAIRTKYGLEERYLLFVGVFEPRKNIPLLVDAFTAFRQEGGVADRYQLVLAGGAGYRGEEIANGIRNRGLGSAVRLLGYVPDKDLPALYRQAELLILPSIYEGFGLPALEAMACGTPVLAADSSSLPEVVGSAGALFSLDGPERLVEQMAAVLASEERLRTMSEQGVRRAAGFTWDQTASRTLEVYREVLGESA